VLNNRTVSEETCTAARNVKRVRAAAITEPGLKDERFKFSEFLGCYVYACNKSFSSKASFTIRIALFRRKLVNQILIYHDFYCYKLSFVRDVKLLSPDTSKLALIQNKTVAGTIGGKKSTSRPFSR
jgi:hypothetical protein